MRRLFPTFVFASLLLFATTSCQKPESGGPAADATELDVDDVADVDAAEVDTTPPDPCAEVTNACETEGALACVDGASERCVRDGSGCLVTSREVCPDGCDDATGRCAAVDPCGGIEPCQSGNDFCQDDTLVRCVLDANGCSVEERTDCAASGFTCEFGLPGGGGPTAFCSSECPMPPACDSPSRSCADASTLVRCSYDANGCLAETRDPCMGGTSCRTEDGITACFDACEDAPACVDATEGSASCRENTVETCSDVDADGCFELIVTQCGGTATCDDASGGPVCSLAPEFTFGTNTLFEGTETFEPYRDGAAFPITQGFQGTWMFVLALRTRGVVSGRIDLEAEVTFDPPDGDSVSIEVLRLSLTDGGDSFLYITDLFFDLALFEPPPLGTPLEMRLRVEDELGTVIEETYTGTVGEQVTP